MPLNVSVDAGHVKNITLLVKKGVQLNLNGK